MAPLTPVSFNLGHGHAVYAGRGESISHRVEPERLDDGHDDFHGIDPRSRFGLQLQVQGVSNRAFAARSFSTPRQCWTLLIKPRAKSWRGTSAWK